MTFKSLIVALTFPLLFSGCFLMTTKSSTPRNVENTSHINYEKISLKMIRTNVASDCLECDTYTISVRAK